MTCAQGLLRLLWGGPKLECYGTENNLAKQRKKISEILRPVGQMTFLNITGNQNFLPSVGDT